MLSPFARILVDAIVMGEFDSSRPDWEAMIGGIAHQSLVKIVTAVDPLKGENGITKAVRIKCDDNEIYVVKGLQVGRSLIAEYIVTQLGLLIDAPVVPAVLVNVPRTLIEDNFSPSGRSTFKVMHFSPGLGHGSQYLQDMEQWDEPVHLDKPENQQRFARLAGLYGWVVGNDHQFLYQKHGRRLVYSHDHGEFFAGGSRWTVETLAKAAPAEFDVTITEALMPSPVLIREVRTAIKKVDNHDIAKVIASVPETWSFPNEDRIALAEYLRIRREQLILGS